MRIAAVSFAALILFAASFAGAGEADGGRLPADLTVSGDRPGSVPRISAGENEDYLANTVIDIFEHNGGIWLVSGQGLNVSYDGGETWEVVNSATSDMVSDNLSAATAVGSRLWVGSNHSEELGGFLYSLSDGVSYSDDNGATWNQIDFSEDGLNIRWVFGGDRTIYDISGHREWLFFSAFAGGFLASRDGGLNWRRIYGTNYDSLQYNSGGTPSFTNRYFSCAVDSSHGDSVFVWAGTAGGFYRFVYAPVRERPYSRLINGVALCDACEDTSYVFYAGNNGVSRGTTEGYPFISRFVDDGLPGPYVTAVTDFRERLLVGTAEGTGQTMTGLAYSDDRGETYWPVTAFNTQYSGGGDLVREFTNMGERLYMAAEEAGLFVSMDTGMSWEQLLVDSSDAASLWNAVNAVFPWEERLLVGTDTGLATLYLNIGGDFDSILMEPFPEYDSATVSTASSSRVVKVAVQPIYSPDDTTTIDSLIYWAATRPLTGEGRPVVARRNADSTSWKMLQVGVNTNDFAFFGDTALVLGDAGIRYSVDGTNPGVTPGGTYIVEEVISNVTVDSLTADRITSIVTRGDTIIIGSDNGFAITNDRGLHYNIFRMNFDTLAADSVRLYSSWDPGIVGDFVPAMGIQYIDDEPARVWISNRHTTYGDTVAISMGQVVPVDADGDVVDPSETELIEGYEIVFQAMYRDDYAWNYAFNGDSVFAGTNAGLLFKPTDTGTAWDTIDLVDDEGEPLTLPGTPVYGLEVAGDYLWVGTDDRTVRIRIDLGDFTDQEPFFVIDTDSPADEVYAFPVPFSNSRSTSVDFHFVVERQAEITLEIYDFAMNMVARVIDNVTYPPGIYPTTGGQRRVWDGYNGQGEQVAVGVYYFKVEYSTGEVHWGKLAVIP